MADRIHSTTRNKASATITVYDTGFWPKDGAFYWACAGCKYTEHGRSSLLTMQGRATEHANTCQFS